MHGIVLLAAGTGSRMGNQTHDKILEKIGNRNAFRMCLFAFAEIQQITSIVVVFRNQEQKKRLEIESNQLTPSDKSKIIFVKGGEQRSDSVTNGLNTLPESCKFAHIHDCARPLIRRESIVKLIKAVEKNIPIAIARPATNTIRKKISGSTLFQTETLERSQIWEMETPQSAPVSWLREGYAKAKEIDISITDDMHAIELLSKEMILLDPGYPNPKITHEHDLRYISSLLES
jgi:2-C-methyl-D-erythritol 4-phosphate cytidylyltransferase